MLSKIARFLNKKKIRFISDVVILVASSYLMYSKFFEFSISGWLLENALNQKGVDIYVATTGIVLVVAMLLKIAILVFDNFVPSRYVTVAPDEISHCLYSINKEVSNHLNKVDTEAPVNIRKLRELHAFKVNIRMVVEALAEHIRKSVNTMIKRKDLFISLYTYDSEGSNNILRYELHYDPKRDWVQSKVIEITDEKFKDYECVKCMKSTDSTCYVMNKKNYAKGNSKRHKTVAQYMGCKLEADGRLLGFLNIEFHNTLVFSGEEEMQEYMEEHVFPFKLLMEYQYLKYHFFGKFEDFDQNWRVA